MLVTLTYGGAPLVLNMPPHVSVHTFAPHRIEHPASFDEFHAAFRAAWKWEITDDSSPLFVVNDAYRHTPTAVVLTWIERILPGILQRARFLVATGAHQPPTDKDLQSIFAGHLKTIRPRVEWHVATDLASMMKVGADSQGSDVYLHRRVFQHSPVILIGSVEPHYFAGFTGGRKSLFPGLTDLATIERNHNMAGSMAAAPMKLDGNPVAEHLESLMALIDTSSVLSVQLVLDSAGTVAGFSIGDVESSFTGAATTARAMFGHTLDQPLDAVLCEMRPPLDKNMYQAQKALENCQQVVANGGTAIVVARCDEGVGSEFFINEAQNWDRTNNRPGDGIYRFGSHKLSRMVAHQKRIDVRLFSSLPDAIVEKVFYHPAGDLSALIVALAQGKSDFQLGVVYDSGHTVLGLEDGKHSS
ncbi:hypothetical protein C3F09_01670 [candidate division GN15 bacterium]|uniref:Nickel-dependent lactate racemase n=1 Tax=candidate division GN15 bacterium TaxID=2072418 RepID=A0A855XAR5_9BACT|nr:MAG: hypothetical protein C3F09_01670 [candidate division GN15 bacterium]